jgi:hypothetical protein
MVKKLYLFFYLIIIFILSHGCVSGPVPYNNYKGPELDNMTPLKNADVHMYMSPGWQEIIMGKEEGTAVQLNAPNSQLNLVFGGLSPLSNYLTVLHIDPSVSDERAFNAMRKMVKETIQNYMLIKGPYTLPIKNASKPVFEIYAGEDELGFDAKMIIAVKKSDILNYKYLVYGAFHRLKFDERYTYDDFEIDFLQMLGSIQ